MQCRCPLCNQIYSMITPQHLKHKHNMTLKEFLLQYPHYTLYTHTGQSKMTFAKVREVMKPWTCSG